MERKIPAYLERMLEERNKLEINITKGREALSGNKFNMPEEELDHLNEQMEYYSLALSHLDARFELACTREGFDSSHFMNKGDE